MIQLKNLKLFVRHLMHTIERFKPHALLKTCFDLNRQMKMDARSGIEVNPRRFTNYAFFDKTVYITKGSIKIDFVPQTEIESDLKNMKPSFVGNISF